MNAEPESAQKLPELPEDPRVRLAGERTLLAWIRTGLALMGLGFVIARFGLFLHELAGGSHREFPSPRLSLWLGIAFVLLGIVMNLMAAREHYRFLDALHRGEAYRAPYWSAGLVLALLLAALGMSIVIYLVLWGS